MLHLEVWKHCNVGLSVEERDLLFLEAQDRSTSVGIRAKFLLKIPPEEYRPIMKLFQQEFEQECLCQRMEEHQDQFVDKLADGMIDMLNQEDVGFEEVFEFKEVPENKRVSLIATKLRGRASAWWQQLKLTREGWKSKSYQFEEDDEFIEETDDQLVSHYIGGLRVHIIDFVNMFDPVTLSDAYQHALAFEKQNRRVGSSSSPAITGGSSGSSNVTS
ncbi:hypothetical protein Tco_0761812 [Tanacetum coccineum]